MTRQHIPDAVLDAAHARSRARAARDWPEADRLRARDRGGGLADRRPRHGLRAVAGGRADGRGGRAASATGRRTRCRRDWTSRRRASRRSSSSQPTGRPTSSGRSTPSPRTSPDGVAWSSSPTGRRTTRPQCSRRWRRGRRSRSSARRQRLGQGAALNVGPAPRDRRTSSSWSTRASSRAATSSRRSSRRSTTLPSASPAGGGSSARTSVGSSEAPPGDVTAIEGYAMAFRRADGAARGPARRALPVLPQPRHLVEPRAPRRGRGRSAPARGRGRAAGERHEHRGWTSLPEAERDRLSKRNFYRIIDRFGRAGSRRREDRSRLAAPETFPRRAGWLNLPHERQADPRPAPGPRRGEPALQQFGQKQSDHEVHDGKTACTHTSASSSPSPGRARSRRSTM